MPPTQPKETVQSLRYDLRQLRLEFRNLQEANLAHDNAKKDANSLASSKQREVNRLRESTAAWEERFWHLWYEYGCYEEATVLDQASENYKNEVIDYIDKVR